MIGRLDLIMILIIIVTASMMFGLHIIKTVDDKLKTTKVYVPPPIVNLTVCDDGDGKYNLCKCSDDSEDNDSEIIEPFTQITYEGVQKPLINPDTMDDATFNVTHKDKVLTDQNPTGQPKDKKEYKSIDQLNKELDQEQEEYSKPGCQNDQFYGYNYYKNRFINPNNLYKGLKPKETAEETLPLPYNV